MKIVLYVLLGIIVLVIGIFGYAFFKLNNIKDTGDLEKRIDKMSLSFIEKSFSPGLGIVVIKGNDVFIKGYGKRNVEQNLLVEPNTIFEIGSISKTFTTLLLQQFINEGKLNLNDPLVKFLPEEAGNIPKDSVTLFHLATHTSGYPRIPEAILNQMKDSLNPYNGLTMNLVFDYLKNPTDKGPINLEEPEYSNFGMGLLGNILEWKSNKTYAQLLEEMVLKPLEMKSTYFQTLGKETDPNLASGYNEENNSTPHWNFQIMGAAGAIRSSPVDMAKYLKANLIKGSSPVSRPLGQTHVSCNPESSSPQGLGWWIDDVRGEITGMGDIIWHNGGTGGFSSYIGICPKTKVGVVVLANRYTEETDKLAVRLLLEASNISFSKKL